MMKTVAACLAFVLAMSLASAQDATSQVNQTWVKDQDHATLALGDNDEFFVAWHSGEGDGDGYGVLARYFPKSGSDEEFVVNQNMTQWDQRSPDIDSNGSDLFVLVWSSGRSVPFGPGFDVCASVLNASGDVVVPDFQVNTGGNMSLARTWPDVAMWQDGSFIVIWACVESDELNFYIKLYDVQGNAYPGFTDPMKINESSSELLSLSRGFGIPDISVNEAGEVFAAWERIMSDGRIIIYGRSFNPYTSVYNGDFRIDSPSPGVQQRRPMVAFNDSRDVVVTWTELENNNVDIYVKRYLGSQQQWESRFRPHDNTSGMQHRSVVELDNLGYFIVAWTYNDRYYRNDIYYSWFDSSGNAFIDDELVTTGFFTRYYDQTRPALDFHTTPGSKIFTAISWESDDQDGEGLGVFVKTMTHDL